MILRKRKSVTNTSEVDSKNRKVDTETGAENNQRKSSKMSMFRDVSDAIEDAHIELCQSIRETMDSLSNDIEGKGIKNLCG